MQTQKGAVSNKNRLLCPLPFGPLYTRHHQLFDCEAQFEFFRGC